MEEMPKELRGLGEEKYIEIILKLAARIKELEAEMAKMREQLNQNSKNSSRPPSSDFQKKASKPVSLRKSSGKKPGAQKGHPGHGHKVDKESIVEVIELRPSDVATLCPNCGIDVSAADEQKVNTRYITDMPTLASETRRVDFYELTCPKCGNVMSVEVPDCLTGTFNYGPNLKALSIVMTQYGMVSEGKTAEILGDITGQPIRVGTIHSNIEECAKKSEPHVEEIKAQMKGSKVICLDETGARIKGETGWFHIASSETAVVYTASHKRGKEGTDQSGILDGFTGVAVHDCWASYHKYDKCIHALCNQHILREMKGILQNDPLQTWCTDMTKLLLEMKATKERYQKKEKETLSRYYSGKFHTQYDEIIKAGQAMNPRIEGQRKQSKAYNLILRLDKFREEFCRFAEDFDVPFTNNDAERAVRPVKVKTKVSGCFRTDKGADDHAAIASVIQTSIKIGESVVGKIKSIFSKKSKSSSALA